MISNKVKKEPDFKVMKIKKEPGSVVTKIKEETGFMLQGVKKEFDYAVKEIKKEFHETEAEFPTTSLKNLQSNSKKKKQKIRTCKKVRKVISRKKRKTSKSSTKSTQSKEGKIRMSISSTSKRSTKKRKTKSRKKVKKIMKNVKYTGAKKETRTLLDQQSSTKLHLFGFKDELEYFPLDSDSEGVKESSSGCDSSSKRTSLSRLDARKKVILALKSTPTSSSSRHKCEIQPSPNENVDLLDSILESQTLWHCKNSCIKVKDDGSVEIISEKCKDKSFDIKLTRSIGTSKKQEGKVSEMIFANKCNELQSPQHGIAKPILYESLKVNNSLKTIKHEPLKSSEMWYCKINTDSEIKQKPKHAINIEIKQEKNNAPNLTPSLAPAEILTSCNSKKIKSEKSPDNEGDDCHQVTRWSNIFFRERAEVSSCGESDVEIVEIKESVLSNKNKNEHEKLKSNAGSKTIKKERNEESEENKACCSIVISGEKFGRKSRSFLKINSRSRSPLKKSCTRSRSRNRSEGTLSSSGSGS